MKAIKGQLNHIPCQELLLEALKHLTFPEPKPAHTREQTMLCDVLLFYVLLFSHFVVIFIDIGCAAPRFSFFPVLLCGFLLCSLEQNNKYIFKK